jgi:hypothetical protein
MRSLILVLLIAACTTHGNAVFTGKSAPQLSRTVFAAETGDVALAIALGSTYSVAPASGASCPAISLAGTNIAVTGGCATSDGTRIDGSVVLDNLPGLGGGIFNPSASSRIEFNAFTTTHSNGDPMRFDGLVTFSAGVTGGSTEASLDVTLSAIRVHEDISFSCGILDCGLDSASIDVDGVGSADLDGSFGSRGFDNLDITASGVDTLHLLAIAGNSSCVQYLINGELAGQVCK